jgi:putative DNA primase/helicase
MQSQASFNNLPAALRGLPNFVLWRQVTIEGQLKKVPYRSNTPHKTASSTDPTTWSTFERAIEAIAAHPGNGLGFVFTNTEFTGIDLDSCRDPRSGDIQPEAKQIMDRFPDVYWEISPSGSGLHGIGRGRAKDTGKFKAPWTATTGNKAAEIEIYDTDSPRYFTITGEKL